MGSILALNHKFFMLPKVDARPKLCFVSFDFFRFFSALCDFFENFRNLSIAFFLKFSVCKNV